MNGNATLFIFFGVGIFISLAPPLFITIYFHLTEKISPKYFLFGLCLAIFLLILGFPLKTINWRYPLLINTGLLVLIELGARLIIQITKNIKNYWSLVFGYILAKASGLFISKFLVFLLILQQISDPKYINPIHPISFLLTNMSQLFSLMLLFLLFGLLRLNTLKNRTFHLFSITSHFALLLPLFLIETQPSLFLIITTTTYSLLSIAAIYLFKNDLNSN